MYLCPDTIVCRAYSFNGLFLPACNSLHVYLFICVIAGPHSQVQGLERHGGWAQQHVIYMGISFRTAVYKFTPNE